MVEIPPDSWASGSIDVCLSLNPDYLVSEPNYANNRGCSHVAFTSVPPVKVRIYDVRFWDGPTLRRRALLDLLASRRAG